MKRAGVFWPMMAVLLLGGLGLRLYHLGPEEFVEGDDATYYLTARSLAVLADWGWDHRAELAAGSADHRGLQVALDAEGVELRFPYYCKPFWDFLNVAALKIGGPAPDSLLWMNVFFGVVALAMVGEIGRFLYGEATGLLAAALLAVSGSALIFSRSGMAHMASIALCLTGVVCYCRTRRAPGIGEWVLLWAGVFGGLALATHPNLLPFVGLLVAFEGVYAFRRGSMMVAVRRVGLIAGGMLVVLASINIVYQGAVYFLGGVLAALPPSPAPLMTYFAQFAAHTQAVIDGKVSLSEKLYTYVLVFWAHEGGALLLLILGSTLVALASWRRGDVQMQVLLALFWVPLIFFIASRNQAVYRYAAGLVVPAVLIGARGLVQVSSWLARRRAWSPHRLRWVGGILLIGYNLSQIGPVYGTRSAWAACGHWLQDRGQREVISSAGLQLWKFSRIAAVPPGSESLLKYRYLANYRRYSKQEEQRLLQALEAQNLVPVYRAEHLRPTKLLEVQFIEKSWVLRLGGMLPWVGREVDGMRALVLERNRLCVLELYDLHQVDLKIVVGQLPDQGAERPPIMTRSTRYAECL